MLFKKKRILPLLALILSTVLVMSVPMRVVATEVNDFSSFTYASFFTAEWTQTNTSGTSSVSVDGNKISFSATGSGSGCDVKANETTVTLTALKDVSITCTLDGANLSPPGEVTDNSDGSKTFVVGEGSTVSFSVSGANGSTTGNGSVTFTKVEEAKSMVPTDCASFSYNNKFYSYLDKALEEVGSGSGTIVVVKDGKLYHSSIETDADYANKTFTFEIPNGVTLLVPYNSANTLIGSDPSSNLVDAYEDPSSPRSEYRKLIMPAGTNLSVDSGGAICISSRIANQFVGQLGSYGAIYMNANSNITIQSGANLYAWGYIFYGDSTGGTVNIQNGGTVYEPISIMDYPGSSSLTNTLKNEGVFPMRAYTVRNVEVPMTLQSSAKEYASYCLWGNRVGTHPGKALMFANAADSDYTPVFQLASGTTITKSFKNKTQYITVDGDVVLNPLNVVIDAKMFGGDITFSSSETPGFVLPSGFDVTLAGGTMTLNDNVVMVEGSKLTIAQGAVANTNGKNLYLTDDDDDVGAVQSTNGCSITVQNVHGDYYTRVAADAVLDINGILKAGSTFYTSANKAVVTSSKGNGIVELTGAPAETSIKVKDASNSYQNIRYTNAQLKNGDGSYLNTSANTYSYDLNAGKWRCKDHTGVTADHTCDVCGYITECLDDISEGAAYADHICDICSKVMSECSDSEDDEDTLCDICGKNLCAHVTIEPVEAVAPSCTQDGIKAHYKCSVCEAQFSDEEKTPITAEELIDPALEHSGGTATCISKAVCETCDQEYGELGDHSYDEGVVTKDATCTAEGEMTYTCTIEGCTEEMEGHTKTESIPATGHTYGEAAYSWAADYSSCTVTLTCSVCEEGTEEHALSATDSKPESRTVSGNCQTEAVTTYTASVELNGTTYSKTETVKGEKDLSVHVNIVDVAGTPATCTEIGYTDGTYCNDCETWISGHAEIPAAGHTPGEAVGENRVESTCTAEGSYDNVVYCTVCNAELSRNTVTVEKTAHTPAAAVEENRLESTCTVAGSYDSVVYCTVCNAELSRNTVTVEKTAHTPAAAVEENRVESTCTVAGSYDSVVYCSACNTELSRETKTLEMAVHTEGAVVVENEVAATCSAEGSYDNVVYCTVCNAELSRNTVTVEKVAHTMSHTAAKDASCTETGKLEFWHCSACEGYFKDAQGTEAYEENAWIIGKTNHTFETTYTTDGEYHWYKCSNSACDAIDDKAKHSYNDGVVTKEPTCTAEGIKTFTCTCGYSYTAGIVATGHRNTEVRNGSEATCGMNGYTGDTYCNDCETTIANGKVIPATGEHTYDNACDAECNVCSAIRTPADHVYDNACDTNCNVCGAERSITHAWNNATCTAPKTCSVCGATEGEATGHVNTTSSTVQNDDGSTHTTTVTCACGEVVSIETEPCTDQGGGTCECGRVMQTNVTVENKTGKADEQLYSISGTTLNVKHDLACVVLVEETGGTYSRLNATAKADGSYDFDVSGVGNKKVVIAVKGDTSGDGNADISDALQIVYSGISNTKPAYQALNSYQACVGELSGDRSVDITDALQIVYSGISTTKPAYAPIEWDVLP